MKGFSRARILALMALALCPAASVSAAGPHRASGYPPTATRFASASSSRVTARSTAAAPQSEEMPAPASGTAPEPVSDGGETWDDFDSGMPFEEEGCCDDGGCGSGGCGLGWNSGRFCSGLWYGSVDYLLVRPRMSQAIAEVRRTLVTDTSVSPNVSNLTDTSVEFPFKYQSAFRAAIGLKLLDCGGDVQVAFWRMTGDAQVSDGPADLETNNPFIAGQLKNNPGQGQFFNASSRVAANILDVDFAKCLSFGGPRDPCDACFCPRWDMRWSAGARVADISRNDNNASSDPDGTATTIGNIDSRFIGGGPKVGFQIRRYFGHTGELSIFAKASQAILLGQYRQSRVKTTPGDAQVPTEITGQLDTFQRMVPVSDIEVGGSWQAAPYCFISAGWFFQCWWDLGQGETVIGTNFGPLDTSNILGFDGLFVRGEFFF